jgi:hypothetical protein
MSGQSPGELPLETVLFSGTGQRLASHLPLLEIDEDGFDFGKVKEATDVGCTAISS